MGFGIRELLMFIGALIFIGVLVDGIRRFINNRRSQIKVSVDKGIQEKYGSEEESIDWYSSELPNGGARIVGQEEYSEEAEDHDQEDRKENTKITPSFSEPSDILMEGYRQKDVSVSTADEQDEDHEEPDSSEQTTEAEIQEQISNEKPVAEDKSGISARRNDDDQGDLFSDGDEQEKTNDNLAEDISLSSPPKADPSLPEEILAINVIAKGEEEINGQELLEAVLAFGLRFGDMDIFHRHEHSNGQGSVIFSMANAINPGTFNIDELPENNIKGVTFFMRLSQVSKRMFVLELMLDIAKRLANQLNAELKDDTHSVLSSQTVTHYKTRIQDYERRYLGQVLRK